MTETQFLAPDVKGEDRSLEFSDRGGSIEGIDRSRSAVFVLLGTYLPLLSEIEARVIAICERDGSATIAGIRDELGTSRKYAQAILEHLDRTKVTRRDGDTHVLRRRR